MCFGGSGGHQGGNNTPEDAAIRKQFSDEKKTARQARAFFRDRDAGKITVTRDETGRFDLDPKPILDKRFNELYDDDEYDKEALAKVQNPNETLGTLIDKALPQGVTRQGQTFLNEKGKTVGGVNAAGNFFGGTEVISSLRNLQAPVDVARAKARTKTQGSGALESLTGEGPRSALDMLDYKDGTVQGLGPNIYMDKRGRGQLTYDLSSPIFGAPSYTGGGGRAPEYDKSRESVAGKLLTKTAQGIKDNPLTALPYFGMANKFLNMLTGGEEKTGEMVDTRPKSGERTNINTDLGLPEDFYARYEGDPQYDMFGDTAYPTVESRDAQFPDFKYIDDEGRPRTLSYRPPSSSMYVYDYGRDMLKDYEGMEYDPDLRNIQDLRMLGLSEDANRALNVPMENPNYSALSDISPQLRAARDANTVKLALAPAPENKIKSVLSNITPNTNFFDNNDDGDQITNIAADVAEDPYADYVMADTSMMPTIGQSGYGGRYSYGASAGSKPNSPFWLRYGLTQGTGFSPTVQAKYVNPTNKTYFMAPRGLDTSLSDFQLA